MNSTLSGTTMNNKYFRCSCQLHCNVLFGGKFNLVIGQNLSTVKKINIPLKFSLQIRSLEKNENTKILAFFLILIKKKMLKNGDNAQKQSDFVNKKNK